MVSSEKVFNVAVFFVVFRECLEAVIVLSVLLSFLKQTCAEKQPQLYKKLRLQVWLGTVAGFFICLVIGGAIIGVYYAKGNDIFGTMEDMWEGIFCVIASGMISVMGVAMLRVNKMKDKWRVKIAKSFTEPPSDKWGRFNISYLSKKYAMFLLPFITVLREGLEAVIFVAGAGVTTAGAAATSYPLPVFVGLVAGALVGVFLYKGTSASRMQFFLVVSTCLLYLISAGLFSRGVWYFENYAFNKATGGDASESGSGNGSYDITKSVYHVNCCNPELDNGWDIFNAILGWQNTGYIGSMLAYNLYWLALMIVLGLMMFEEKKGHLPFTKNLKLRHLNPMYWIKGKNKQELSEEEKDALFQKAQAVQFTKAGRVTNSTD